MAVIYMPEDLRSRAWGQAVQNFVNGVFQARNEKKIKDAIASGESDPVQLAAMAGGDPEMQKFVDELLKAQGVKRQGQLAESTMARNQADIENIHSEEQARQFTQERETKLLPGQLAMQAAQITASNAMAALHAAEIKGIPSEINARNAAAAASIAQVQSLRQEMEFKNKAAQALLGGGDGQPSSTDETTPTSLTQPSRGGGDYLPLSSTATGQQLGMLSPGPRNFSPTGGKSPGDSFLASLKPDEKSLMTAALAEKGMSGYLSAQKSIMKERETETNRRPLPAQHANEVVGSAMLNNDINEFLDNLPQIKTGGFTGKIQALGQAYGFDTSWLTGVNEGGRTFFNTAEEAMLNAKRNNAISGGGFMSKERITLAGEVQPGPLKDRMTNLISAGISQSSQLSQLKALRDVYATTKPAYDIGAIDKQIEATMGTLKRIDDFAVDNKTGALVDMDRLRQLMPSGSAKTLSGKTITVEDLKSVMFKLQATSGGTDGLTPDAVLKKLLANY